jgi:hypothetical protein
MAAAPRARFGISSRVVRVADVVHDAACRP